MPLTKPVPQDAVLLESKLSPVAIDRRQSGEASIGQIREDQEGDFERQLGEGAPCGSEGSAAAGGMFLQSRFLPCMSQGVRGRRHGALVMTFMDVVCCCCKGGLQG